MAKKIVAITACPVGIAHTYMAATALETIAKEKGHTIRVEKQGSMGPEDVLTDQEIAEAELVIIAVNKNVNLDRFKGKLLYQTTADHAMKNKEEVFANALSEATIYGVKGSIVGDGIILGKTNNVAMNHIMAGLSYMIPMVVTAGLLLALSSVFGFQKDEFGRVTQWGFDESTVKGYFLAHMHQIGKVGFLLMIPLLAGFIANSIAGMPAIAPAMIGAFIANDAKFLGTESGGGFIAAILVAFMVGYFIRYLKMIKWPNFFKPILGIMILPIIGTIFIMVVVTYGIGKPISILMTTMYGGLDDLMANHPNSKFLIGFILGGMMGFDFGGPVNKTAYMFGAAVYADTIAKYGIDGATFGPTTATNAASSCAPLGIWLASKLFSKYFTKDEHVASNLAFSTGIVGITEGSIPFAVNHPLQIISSSVIGSGLSGGLAYAMDIRMYAGMGGPLGTFFGYVVGPIPIISWLFVTCAGILATALMIGLWRIVIDRKVLQKHSN